MERVTEIISIIFKLHATASIIIAYSVAQKVLRCSTYFFLFEEKR